MLTKPVQTSIIHIFWTATCYDSLAFRMKQRGIPYPLTHHQRSIPLIPPPPPPPNFSSFKMYVSQCMHPTPHKKVAWPNRASFKFCKLILTGSTECLEQTLLSLDGMRWLLRRAWYWSTLCWHSRRIRSESSHVHSEYGRPTHLHMYSFSW